MENGIKHSMLARLSGVCFSLLVGAGGALSDEHPPVEPQGEEQASTDTRDGNNRTQGQQEDILDRVFSPLDKAVSDVNRDLNQEDEQEASQPHNQTQQ